MVVITQPMIQFLALGFTVFSSFFFSREMVIAKPSLLAELARTKYNYNSGLVKSFSQQKSDAMFGFLFLFFSICFQGMSFAFPARWVDFDGLPFGVFLIEVFLLLSIFSVSLKINKYYSNKWEVDIKNILENKI